MLNSKLKKLLKTVAASLGIVLLVFIGVEIFVRLTAIVWCPVYQKLFDHPDKLYIYALGESTSLGVQYDEKISPAILVAEQFKNRIKQKEIEIIQLAESGQTAEYMYFRFYFHLLLKPHKNGLVLIYSGINEGIENTKSYNFDAWKLVQHSIVLSKLAHVTGIFVNNAERFEYRYRQTCWLASKHNFKIVLSQLVGNVREFPPNVPDNDGLLEKENYRVFRNAKALYDRCEYKSAEKEYEELNKNFLHKHPYLLFQIAQCKFKTGNSDSAAAILKVIPEINNYLGFAEWKNKIIEKVANEEHAAVAKIFDRFCDSSENHILGYDLINDAHHPNLKGYCIMANAFCDEISRLYSEPKPPEFKPNDISKRFAFTNAFYSNVYYKLVEWYIYNLFNTEVRDERINRLRFYLHLYEGLNPDDELIVLWNLIVCILEKDKLQFAKQLHRFNACERKKELLNRWQRAFQNERYVLQIKKIIEPWIPENANERKWKEELLSALDF